MVEEYEQKRRKQVSRMRSIMDYTMGTVFSVLGLLFLYFQVNNRYLLGRRPDPLNYFIGLLFLAYGAWRIYRGYKKNYFHG
ncbi:MAG: hypothetical protein EOO15_19780 [Chitinophagaceae bacterium]|nr:MAG: hypothetical protein EOO15_19780 [Chitinophagaceae bacterium]